MNKQYILRILLSLVGVVFFWFTVPYFYRIYIILIPAIAIYFLLTKLEVFSDHKEPYIKEDESSNFIHRFFRKFSSNFKYAISEVVTIIRKSAMAILVICTIVAISIIFITDYLKEKRTETTLNEISAEIEKFTTRNSRLPENLGELVARNPLLASLKNDFWNNPIIYTKLSTTNYQILSKGKDAEINTEDDLKLQK